jgi:hypothetical protein
VCTGLLAFALSWLGGHPLLIDEPSFAFWMLFGAVSGWGASLDTVPGLRLRTWIVPVAIALIVASVPVRVDRQKADFDLEHRGVGLSTWRDAVDGVRYRLAGSLSSVFLPADAQMVVVPLRAVRSVPDLRLELRLDGRPADIVAVPSDRWLYLRLALHPDRNGPRFRRLDLHIANAPSGDTDVLMIGKVEPK